MSKVFGIGLNKTGTTSLSAALEILGFQSLHWGSVGLCHAAFMNVIEQRCLLEELGDYDAYCDISAFSENFFLLDVQYPESKFILTTRPFCDWAYSRAKHVARNVFLKASGVEDCSWVNFDYQQSLLEYDLHHARVLSYFQSRPEKLLVIDITAGQGWDHLCAFLNKPVPETLFPWENKFEHNTKNYCTSHASDSGSNQ